MSVPVECVISCKKYACFQHTALIILGLVKMIFVMFFRDVPWEYIFNLYVFVAPEQSTASGFTLELLYISLNESVKSSLFGLKSSHLLVLLPLIVKTILFVFTAKANLVNLMPRLGRPGSCGEVFLNLLSCVDKRWVSSYFRTVTLFDIFLK